MRYYQSGYRKELQTYKGGIMNGVAKSWDRYGHPLQEMYYLNGKPEGPFQEWYPNRILKVDGHFKDGMHDGVWLYYDEFGKVTGQGEFTSGNGTQKVYFASGQTKQLTHYRNNVKDGDEIFYSEDGKITRCITYRAGTAVTNIAPADPKK